MVHIFCMSAQRWLLKDFLSFTLSSLNGMYKSVSVLKLSTSLWMVLMLWVEMMIAEISKSDQPRGGLILSWWSSPFSLSQNQQWLQCYFPRLWHDLNQFNDQWSEATFPCSQRNECIINLQMYSTVGYEEVDSDIDYVFVYFFNDFGLQE